MAGLRHKDKHVQRALVEAEGAGWRIEKCGPRAHCWARLYCPYRHPECQLSVYGTPARPEHHARRIRRLLGLCPGPSTAGSPKEG